MQVRDTSPHHTDFLNSLERRWGIPSHREDGHRDPVSSVRRRGAAVVRVRDKEAAKKARDARALLPASRVIRHARRNFACKPIEGAHGQRGQIISAGRRVLVEGLSQQVHVASCDQATNCWRNSACGLYIGTIRSTSVRGLRKGPSLYGGLHFSYTLVSRSYYYLRKRSPGPPFPPHSRPTTVRQGNGGL